jgi:microsomal dipeptidase-like Zn-dependent dipeptidase
MPAAALYIYPEGNETPSTLPDLTAHFNERGFSDADVGKLLGLNWMSVFADVWNA